MISICITLKNRTRLAAGDRIIRPFIHCVESLAGALAGTSHELVVSDWQSTDAAPLGWLNKALPHVPITIVAMPAGPFSRGRGLNAAAHWARGDVLFFSDTDIVMASTVIAQAESVARAGKVFFPICYSYDDARHTRGHWRQEGYGLMATSRDTFIRVGSWDAFTQWGGEDRRMVQRVLAAKIEIERVQCQGLYHLWHPPMTQKGQT